MAKKLTYEFVKSSFEKEGYTLLSKGYKNSHTKLDYKCPEGHIHSITWHGWSSGYRCPYCAGNVKLTIEYIREQFENEGYTLLSKTYLNGVTKLDCICPYGHSYSVAWTNWLSGHRCSTCKGNKKFTFNEVLALFEKEGYTLLSTEYINSRTKLKYRCPKGHINTVSLSNWNQGVRCRECQKDRIYSSFRKDLNEIEQSFISEGWEVDLSIYKNADSKLTCVCPQGHIQTKSWNRWLKGHRCAICYSLNAIGENSPAWKGGKSLEPYCEVWKDREYKQDIRERDGNKCLNPYCYGNDEVLSIHHIDYNKKNCHPSNLITVCRSCNSRANTNRKWHKAWYQAIMHRRYNYDYN